MHIDKVNDIILIFILSKLMPNAQEAGNSEKTEQFQVSLNYRKIVWEHVASGTSGSDDWRNA